MLSDKVTDIFFDLDHTLWDFEKNSALTFQKIFKSNNVTLSLNDFLRVYVPKNFELWKLYGVGKISKEQLRYQRLKTVFDELGYSASDDLIDNLSEDYIAYLSSFNSLFPGTIEILDYLKPKYQLHIITNGFQEIQGKKLRNSAIENYFEHVIDSETAGVKKPNPIIFETALNIAKVSANKAIMIGDNLEADILGAQAVGMHALHFNSHSSPEHDFCSIINNLDEIKNFL